MDGFLRRMTAGPRRILVTGHFGSGKTEFAVSLAFKLSGIMRQQQNDAFGNNEFYIRESRLALCDLDIENPYFRSRERQDKLNGAGVTVYSDPYGGHNGSELQTISPQIFAPIEDTDCRVIVDTGGDYTGAMILNQYGNRLKDAEGYELLAVINRNRPGTDTVEKASEQIRLTESATGLKVTGLVSNAHLIRYTTKDDVMSGWRFTEEVGAATNIPVLCVCCMKSVAELFPCGHVNDTESPEIFEIGMYMRDSYLDARV